MQHTALTENRTGWRCPAPEVEPLLRSLIGGLFAESGLVPPGSVIDAGANSGEEACYYAERQPQRLVHAVEPVDANVRHIQRLWGSRFPNLRVLRGALGSVNRLVRDQHAARKLVGGGSQITVGTMNGRAAVHASESDAPGVFRVYRIDDLFAGEWRGERLGFAHFDVEGGELDVVRGASATLKRDRPVFTVEVHPHNKPNETVALLQEIRLLGYRSFLVEEQCGVPVDCRNLLNLPREARRRFLGSATLDFATASGKLVAVTPSTIATQAYAAACAAGGVCCPHGPPCCYNTCVQTWLKGLVGRDASKHAHRAFMNKAFTRRNLFQARRLSQEAGVALPHDPSCTGELRGLRSNGNKVIKLTGGRWLKCANNVSDSVAQNLPSRCHALGAIIGNISLWPPHSIQAELVAYSRLRGLNFTAPVHSVQARGEGGGSGFVIGSAGVVISRQNLPADAMEQVSRIATALRRARVSNNNIKREEVFVHDGTLRLVDFGLGTPGWAEHVRRREAGCGTAILFQHTADDENALRSAVADTISGVLSAKSMGNMWQCPEKDPMPMRGRRPPELHAMLVWNSSQLALARQWIEAYHANHSTRPAYHGIHVVSTRKLRLTPRWRAAMCKSDYIPRLNIPRGCDPGEAIGLILLNDTSPVYGWQTLMNAHALQNFNLRVKRLADGLLSHLRAQVPAHASAETRPKLLDASVNTEEALRIVSDGGLSSLMIDSRPRFASFRELFEMLDAFAPFKYVVFSSSNAIETAETARSYETFHNGHQVVDVFVNDYYFFKAKTGARSTDPVHMRESNSSGHVENAVLVGDRNVHFNVRFPGDGFVDSAWISDLLKRQDRLCFPRTDVDGDVEWSFHVPRADDRFFLRLYHLLLRKPAAPLTSVELRGHLAYLAPLAADAGVRPPPSYEELSSTAPRLWDELERFLGSHRYSLTCPTDPSVAPLLPWRLGASVSEQMLSAPFRCVAARCGPTDSADAATMTLRSEAEKARRCVQPTEPSADRGPRSRYRFCWRGKLTSCPTDIDPMYHIIAQAPAQCPTRASELAYADQPQHAA